MSDEMNPTGPSQPSLNQAYETAGNPVSKEPVEETRSTRNAQSDSAPIAHRDPTQSTPSSDATPSSLGRGVHGAPAGEERHGMTQADVDRRGTELDAAQMGAPGEGKVEDAVQRKPGATGSEPGLEADLDRKRAEQAPRREAVQEQQSREVDVGGVLGQRGGPANPVDKGGYPNTGS